MISVTWSRALWLARMMSQVPEMTRLWAIINENPRQVPKCLHILVIVKSLYHLTHAL